MEMAEVDAGEIATFAKDGDQIASPTAEDLPLPLRGTKVLALAVGVFLLSGVLAAFSLPPTTNSEIKARYRAPPLLWSPRKRHCGGRERRPRRQLTCFSPRWSPRPAHG